MPRKSAKEQETEDRVALWARPIVWAFRMLLERPRDSALAMVCAGAIGTIVINSLYMQPGPHPAPIFVLRHSPVLLDEPTGAVAMLPRPRPVVPGQDARADTRRIEPAVQPKPQPATARTGAPRHDPIGELLGGNQLTAIQRALSEFGYGPVAVTGQYGPETRAAIERFERDRKLPVTGQVSDRLVRELSTMIGKPI